MRAAVPVLLLIGCGGAPAPTASPASPASATTAAPARLRLTAVPRAVGDRFDETSYDHYDVMVDGVHIVELQEFRCSREVRAVADGAVTEQLTSYHHFHVEQRRDDRLAIGPDLSGHTYRVAVAGGELAITRDDGAALDPAEHEQVARDHGDLGHPMASTALEATAWEPGVEVALDAAAQRRFFGEEASGTATMTLTAASADTVTFAGGNHRRFGDGVEVIATGTFVYDRATLRLRHREGTATLTGAWVGRAERRGDIVDLPPP
ncbi:MAG: hypothetical protein JNK64_17925 [Myxococcales bacterium]|nr:hypothetical protein [Myxococcales bacterium]